MKNLRQMEVFHAIMDAGSVSGAARLLNISQPAVTNLLRHTEDQLRFRLFERIKGRLHPTPEARILYDQVHLVFEHVQAARQLVEDLRETKSGHLNIATIPSLGMMALPLTVTQFLAGRPQVKIRLQVRPQRQVLALIASHAIDIGFAFLSPQHGNVSVRELMRANLICIMPDGHPLAARERVTPRDLARYPFIGYARTQGLYPLIAAALNRARIAIEPTVEVGLISTAWALVQGGAGVALVDGFSRMEQMFRDVVMRPFVPAIPLAVEMLHPTARPPSLLASSFTQYLGNAFSGAEIAAARPEPRAPRPAPR